MLAARFEGPDDLRIGDFPDPIPGVGEVLVRVGAVGICATDLEVYHGALSYFTSGMARYPIIPGHEWAGEVVALGEDTRGFAVGDQVTGECGMGCRACRVCLEGRYQLCPDRVETGILNRDGAFAELLAFPAVFLHRIDPPLPMVEACLIEPSAVANHAVHRVGVTPRDTVAVLGAGPIGLLTAQMARIHGAGAVVLLDTRPHRLALGRELGFSHSLDAADSGTVSAVRALTFGGPTVIIDATGNPAALDLAAALAAPSARIAAVGVCGGQRPALDLDSLVTRELSLIGCLGSPHAWPNTIAMLQDGRLRTKPLVSHVLPLTRLREAFSLIEKQTPGVVKIVVQP
ncbi:MAG TPA: alcohol dehydrogenase catalytic domain-containing protein [Chloroflexota bacterium]|nr:alcohol dehydrogenase catalytic domain-containing protein [Chloroflexota bacterium]